MRFSIKEVEDAARLKLTDTYSDNYRFEPTEIFAAMREGVRMIRSIRPESKYVDYSLTGEYLYADNGEVAFVVPESFPCMIGSTSYSIDEYRELTVNMEQIWFDALVFYVVYQMYLKEDPDTSNANLANAYYAKFLESVKS